MNNYEFNYIEYIEYEIKYIKDRLKENTFNLLTSISLILSNIIILILLLNDENKYYISIIIIIASVMTLISSTIKRKKLKEELRIELIKYEKNLKRENIPKYYRKIRKEKLKKIIKNKN